MKVIAFSGVDGSGKTTQAKAITAFIKKQGSAVEYVHIFSPRQTVMSRIHEQCLVNWLLIWIRKLKNNSFTIPLKIGLRIANVIIDSWLFQSSWRKKRVDVVICDRYFYDVLAVLAFDFPRWNRLIIASSRVVRKPDHIFILLTEPATVASRITEHSLDDIGKFTAIYRQLGEKRGAAVLTSENSSKGELNKIVKEYLAGLFNSHQSSFNGREKDIKE